MLQRAQHLRALAALAWDQGWIPSIHNCCNSSSKGPYVLFWSQQALHAHGAQTFRQNTRTYKIKKKSKK